VNGVDANRPVGEPSYVLSAVGGFFLGVLGVAILVLFPDQPWGMGVVPVVGLAAAILGTYVAAEPYVELRESYDRLISSAATQASATQAAAERAVGESAGPVASTETLRALEERAHKAEAAHQVAELALKRAEEASLREGKALAEAEARLADVGSLLSGEGAKLLDAAAELGADGEKVAAVAESLRQECIKLKNTNALK
jgi:hypothetical protein